MLLQQLMHLAPDGAPQRKQPWIRWRWRLMAWTSGVMHDTLASGVCVQHVLQRAHQHLGQRLVGVHRTPHWPHLRESGDGSSVTVNCIALVLALSEARWPWVPWHGSANFCNLSPVG